MALFCPPPRPVAETVALGLTNILGDEEVCHLLLPYLLPRGWLALGAACTADAKAVQPVYKKAYDIAHDRDASLIALVGEKNVAAACLRLKTLSGIDLDAVPSMPRLVQAAFSWAHYGKVVNQSRPAKRSEHLQKMSQEFPPADPREPVRGIQATMRQELVAVRVVTELGLAVHRDINEVDILQLVPVDTPGKAGCLGVVASRPRGESEATVLMWATRHGVRWVEMFLSLGADAKLVTPAGWTALLYGSIFQSRGVVADGSTACNEEYGGYRRARRGRGVVGPLLDAGATCTPTLSLKAFQHLFAPSPVSADMVGPVEVVSVEIANEHWSNEILEQSRRTADVA